jgi:cytochrome P450
MLSMLLDAKDENGQGRSDEALRDELLTLVATGHETTATALAWGLYWTSKHGHVRERIRKEIATLGPNPDPNAYTQLEYLDATCKEILRIYPIVPSVFRQVAERPFRVMDYVFEPGEILSPSIYLTHHREDLYPDPDAFEPDRFLRRTYSPYEYLPFGGGVRRCIGMSFALYETKVILARLLGAYDLEVASDQDVVPCRRTVTMAPSGGPRVTVKKVRS